MSPLFFSPNHLFISKSSNFALLCPASLPCSPKSGFYPKNSTFCLQFFIFCHQILFCALTPSFSPQIFPFYSKTLVFPKIPSLFPVFRLVVFVIFPINLIKTSFFLPDIGPKSPLLLSLRILLGESFGMEGTGRGEEGILGQHGGIPMSGETSE